ncbi:MAG TPA: hypothetical protein VL475_11570, partial [Planctomycetaceae bacterium]|nr:hypothetical protein [Planctomycetaceae bacterium]
PGLSLREEFSMPLMLKTLQEVSAELGMPEAEIKTLVSLNKIHAFFKKGKMAFAPDEIAKIKRQRKSLPESAIRSSLAELAAQPKPQPPKSPPPRR